MAVGAEWVTLCPCRCSPIVFVRMAQGQRITAIGTVGSSTNPLVRFPEGEGGHGDYTGVAAWSLQAVDAAPWLDSVPDLTPWPPTLRGKG